MNEIKIFQNQDFGEVRVVVKEDEPWFVAADVCRALDLGNTSQALTRLDADEKDVILNDTPGGKQDMSIVSEPGLYALVLTSRKPEARAFKRWITHDILPSIRKTGAYSEPRQPIVFQPPTIGATNQQRIVKLDEAIFQFVHSVARQSALPVTRVVNTIIRESIPYVKVVGGESYDSLGELTQPPA